MKRVLLSLATALSISACATTSSKAPVAGIAYDEGDLQRLEKSRTYHWSLPSQSELNPYNNQDLYLALVKTDVDAQLAQKGYRLVRAGGDLEVSFLMLYKDGATTSIVDQYFGTNRAPERAIVKAMKQVPTPPNYEIGTLIVDAEDGRDHESLWRGAVSSQVDRSKPFETQKERIDGAVALLLKQFPAAK